MAGPGLSALPEVGAQVRDLARRDRQLSPLPPRETRPEGPHGKPLADQRRTDARPVLLPLLLLLFLAQTSALQADIASEFGISPRAMAMGNAYTALADDFSGYFHNPAGVATRPHDTLVAGFLFNQPRVMLRLPDGREGVGFDENLKGGLLGFSLDLGQWTPARFRRPWVMGMTVVFPDSFKTYVNADIKPFDEIQYPVFGRAHDFSLMFIGTGMQLHRMLYLGVSVRVSFTADIRDLSLRFDASNILKPVITYNKLDINPDIEMQPIVGVLLVPWENLRIGAAWRKGGNLVTFLGAVKVTVDTGTFDLPLPPYAMFVMDFYQPEEIAVSVAYAFLDKLLLAVELTYAGWSAYNLPYGRGTPGNPLQDILIPRVGLEYRPLPDLSARLGYYYQPTPVKSVQPFTQLLDADQHVFSTGLGYIWRWPESYIAYPLEFGLYLQFKHLPRRTLDTVAGKTSVWGRHLNMGLSVQFRF